MQKMENGYDVISTYLIVHECNTQILQLSDHKHTDVY